MAVRPRRPRRPRTPRVSESPAPPYGAASRLLLDTHAWLWWQAGDRRLGPVARGAITRAAEVYFSAASAWEIAIKASLGKLTLPRGEPIGDQLERDGFRGLDVTVAHAEALRGVPRLHRDPFDRLLIAQALTESLVLVTADSAFARYAIPVLPAGE